MTDRIEIPIDTVSGYYEAKLEIMGGAYADAMGSVPLIVHQGPAAPASAVLAYASASVRQVRQSGREATHRAIDSGPQSRHRRAQPGYRLAWKGWTGDAAPHHVRLARFRTRAVPRRFPCRAR